MGILNATWMHYGYASGWTLRRCRAAVPRILVVKPGSLGDILLFSGVIAVIAKEWPACEIDVMVSRRSMVLARTSDAVCNVFSVEDDRRGRIGDFYAGLRVGLRGYKKVVVHTLGSAPILPGVFMIHGSKYTDLAWVSHETLARERGAQCHILESYCELVRRAGVCDCEIADIFPRMPVARDDARRAEEMIDPLRRRGKVVAFSPFCRARRKNWGADRFLEVLKLVSAEERITVALLGGEEDSRNAEWWSASLKGAGICGCSFVGKTTISGAAAILGRVDVYLGNDSFLGHLAVVAGCPSVTVAWNAEGRMWVPWTNLSKHVQLRAADVPCAGCRGVCEHDYPECLRQISEKCVSSALLERIRR